MGRHMRPFFALDINPILYIYAHINTNRLYRFCLRYTYLLLSIINFIINIIKYYMLNLYLLKNIWRTTLLSNHRHQNSVPSKHGLIKLIETNACGAPQWHPFLLACRLRSSKPSTANTPFGCMWGNNSAKTR